MTEEPWDEGAEQAVLGCMMLSSLAIGDALGEVKAADFHRPAHELIFVRIVEMYLRGEGVNSITLASSLAASGDLVRAGGAPYLGRLMGTPPTAAQAAFYAHRVASVARLRRFRSAGMRIHRMGQETVLDDLDEILDKARDELEGVAGPTTGRGTAFADALRETLEEVEDPPENPVIMRSGIPDLDGLYRGARPGGFTVVGARPAHGKSIMGLSFIRENTIKGAVPTLLFTMEMGSHEITRRLVSAYAGVDLHRLTDPQTHKPSEQDWWAINRVHEELEAAPLEIVEDEVSLADVVSASRDYFRGAFGLVVVDFHQLMRWPGHARTREEAVGYNAYGLKQLARSQGLAVVDLAQLNREPTRRAGGVPQSSDIGESDKLPQAADAVILIDRPETRDENDQPGEANLIVAKQRDGPTGIVTVAFRGHRARFDSLARHAA